jgi:hypothetical protein
LEVIDRAVYVDFAFAHTDQELSDELDGDANCHCGFESVVLRVEYETVSTANLDTRYYQLSTGPATVPVRPQDLAVMRRLHELGDLGRADQQELVAVALNRQPQRLVSRR